MTPLPAAFVRTAVVFLCVGFALGGWMLSAPGLGLPVPAGMRVVHIHFLMVGFFANMVMGVSLWMFPAPPGEGRTAIARQEPRGWSAFGLLLTGLLLRGGIEFNPAWRAITALAWLMVLASVLQVAAAFIFAAAIWERTRSRTFIKKTTAAQRLRKTPLGHELDLRGVFPVEWPSAVLQAWNTLGAGEHLIIQADGDPRTVVKMLTRDQPGRPRSEALVTGPPLWRVRLLKPPGEGSG